MPEEVADAMSATPRNGAMPSTTDILAEYRRLGIRPISGGSTEEDDAAKAAAEAKAKAEAEETAKLGEAGKKALDAEREARAAADKRAKETEKRAKEAEDRLAAIEADEQKRKDDAAKAAGEFEKLAGDRQTKLDEAKATVKSLTEERDALAARVATFEDRDGKRAAEMEKALPDSLKSLYPTALPLSDRLDWLEKAIAADEGTQATPLRFPTTPRSTTPPRDQVVEAEKERLRKTGSYGF